jgi:hypothetical protein
VLAIPIKSTTHTCGNIDPTRSYENKFSLITILHLLRHNKLANSDQRRLSFLVPLAHSALGRVFHTARRFPVSVESRNIAFIEKAPAWEHVHLFEFAGAMICCSRIPLSFSGS